MLELLTFEISEVSLKVEFKSQVEIELTTSRFKLLSGEEKKDCLYCTATHVLQRRHLVAIGIPYKIVLPSLY